MADLLLLNLREQDLICRFGGDRFAIILPDTKLEQAEILKNEIRLAAEHLAFKLKGSDQSAYQTISIGYVQHTDQSSDELIKEANAALLQNKALHQAA